MSKQKKPHGVILTRDIHMTWISEVDEEKKTIKVRYTGSNGSISMKKGLTKIRELKYEDIFDELQRTDTSSLIFFLDFNLKLFNRKNTSAFILSSNDKYLAIVNKKLISLQKRIK